MKKPKFSDLRVDPIRTKEIRELAKNATKIKITVYIDQTSLVELKSRAEKNGAKYQTLLNKILKDHLSSEKDTTEARLEKIEHELIQLKSLFKKAA
jgi:predicted DNA binding CopG/RHH family protein